MDEYLIKINDFEGPLDLLIDLIKQKKYDIYDLPISAITKDYMNRLETMRGQDIEVTSDFMDMASLLLQIKTKMLLPTINKDDDPRNELVKQLLDYKVYKENVEKMKELQEIEQKFFKRVKKMVVRKKRPGVIDDIYKTFQEILLKKMKSEHNSKLDELTNELNQSNFTIEDRIEHLKVILEDGPIEIVSLFDSIQDREEAIVTFSATLELVKSQFAAIAVDENDNILIYKKGVVDE